MLTILSLGAGVQSTTVALLAAHGELRRPDRAIFADTGSEPAAVYRYLAWLQSGVLPFPIDIVRPNKRSLRDEIIAATKGEALNGSHARPPFYVLKPDGDKGMIRRQCTGDYKIEPIQKRIRELLGLTPGQRWPRDVQVDQWMGISRDEATRMRQSRIPAIALTYPLIDLGFTRHNCLSWLAAHGYPEPPKSACTFCPYHNDLTWRQLRDTDAAGWRDAVAVDHAIRHGLRSSHLSGELYLHPSLKPLDEVDLSTAAERGQPNLFENECEGHCGV